MPDAVWAYTLPYSLRLGFADARLIMRSLRGKNANVFTHRCLQSEEDTGNGAVTTDTALGTTSGMVEGTETGRGIVTDQGGTTGGGKGIATSTTGLRAGDTTTGRPEGIMTKSATAGTAARATMGLVRLDMTGRKWRDARRLRRVQSPCHSGNGRRLAGMCTIQVLSSTVPNKRNKQVRAAMRVMRCCSFL